MLRECAVEQGERRALFRSGGCPKGERGAVTGLLHRRFPVSPGVALGGKVQLRGNNVGNLQVGAKRGGKTPNFHPGPCASLGQQRNQLLPRSLRVPRSRRPRCRGRPRAGPAPGRWRGAERWERSGSLACSLQRTNNPNLGRSPAAPQAVVSIRSLCSGRESGVLPRPQVEKFHVEQILASQRR